MEKKYKVGDKVNLLGIEYKIYSSHFENQMGAANDLVFDKLGVEKYSYCSEAYGYQTSEGVWPVYRHDDIEAINKIINKILGKQTKFMSLKSKFTQLFLSEPEKTFRKAGVTNGDGILTQEGQEVFLTWLLKKNGDAFKAEVVDQLPVDKE